jgi:soluble lytic murein transglycosylase-like protein
MRKGTRPLLLVLAGLTGCAMHRQAAPTPPMIPASTTITTASRIAAPAQERADAAPAEARITATARLGCGNRTKAAAWERQLRTDRSRFSMNALLAQGKKLLPELQRIFVEAGAPRGLAFVAAIESGFRVDARGQRGERGLWQLKPERARQLGLVVNPARDDRVNPALSTRAAARHLLELRARYEDWALALAAYSAGDGRVDDALRGRRGATFWELADQGRLPRTARNFVANVFALVRIAAPEECEAPVAV